MTARDEAAEQAYLPVSDADIVAELRAGKAAEQVARELVEPIGRVMRLLDTVRAEGRPPSPGMRPQPAAPVRRNAPAFEAPALSVEQLLEQLPPAARQAAKKALERERKAARNYAEIERWRCIDCGGPLPGHLVLYCSRECARTSRRKVFHARRKGASE